MYKILNNIKQQLIRTKNVRGLEELALDNNTIYNYRYKPIYKTVNYISPLNYN